MKDLAKKALEEVGNVANGSDFFSVRMYSRNDEQLAYRHGVIQPPSIEQDLGVMITVVENGGLGYGATCDVSASGIKDAAERARFWAKACAERSIVDFSKLEWSHAKGEYRSKVARPWTSESYRELLDRLEAISQILTKPSEIIDSAARIWHVDVEQLYLTSAGGELWQQFSYVYPGMFARASIDGEVQMRSFGEGSVGQQGGLEILDRLNYDVTAQTIVEEALALCKAPDCPSGVMDLLLAPDQMILQIHESIGHPLELDRILGDERNYAGTSFVTMDMFGSYQYGSSLLNVTYDPSVEDEIASFAFDDDGMQAQKAYIIKDGILKRPLGGAVSMQRARVDEGVANARAVGWNRPPIDRMANLNVEPGANSWQELISQIDRGVLMHTNCSWSIDDSRNKFQFGCEIGQMIENGKLTHIVKKPNYRGISANFWRSLKAVGDRSTMMVMGTPFCGKGEPNQAIHVGHASPACLFTECDVFGGA